MKAVLLALVSLCAIVFSAAPAGAGEQTIVMNKTGVQIAVWISNRPRYLGEGGTVEVHDRGFSVTGPHTCVGGHYADGSCAKEGPDFACELYQRHMLDKGLYIVRYVEKRGTPPGFGRCTITRYYPYG